MPLVVESQSGQANLPLGVLRQVPCDQGEARVQAGDRILLYTDGLSEAMRPESGEEFGDGELLTLLESQGENELASVRDSLVEAATAFSGGPVPERRLHGDGTGSPMNAGKWRADNPTGPERPEL